MTELSKEEIALMFGMLLGQYIGDNAQGKFKDKAREILSKKKKGWVVAHGSNFTGVNYAEAVDAMEEFVSYVLKELIIDADTKLRTGKDRPTTNG